LFLICSQIKLELDLQAFAVVCKGHARRFLDHLGNTNSYFKIVRSKCK